MCRCLACSAVEAEDVGIVLGRRIIGDAQHNALAACPAAPISQCWSVTVTRCEQRRAHSNSLS